MYLLPGCYSFRDEIRMCTLWLREQVERVLYKFCELERLLKT